MTKPRLTILWQHSRYASYFVGGYDYDKAGNRIFELTGLIDQKKKRIKFENGIKEAKQKGWKKVVI